MSMRLQKRSWKNADGSVTETWRLIIEEWSTGSRVSIYPEKHHYSRYGLSQSDTFEQAKEKLQIVRAQQKIARQSKQRAKIEARIRKDALITCAYLPTDLYGRFIKFLKNRRAWDDIPPKTESHLRCMRKLIRDLNCPPQEWPEQPARIYKWFITQGLSHSYLEKVLPVLNEYGYFYCKEMHLPFLHIPMPTGQTVEKINDSNYDARDGRTKESLPLRPEHLEKLPYFTDGHIQWLKYSLYFGLRPEEVDQLTVENQGKKWFAEKDPKGLPILVLYQSKLVKIPRAKRWKRIPCLLKEQKKLLSDVIKGVPIKRPYAKYLQKNLGPGFGLYGGRKGFHKLMQEKGQQEINIHRWLGKRDFRDLDNQVREIESASLPKTISKMLGHHNMNTTAKHYIEADFVDYD